MMNQLMILLSDDNTIWDKVGDTLVNWFLSVGKNILIAVLILIIGSKLIKWILKHIGKAFQKTTIEPIVSKFLISFIKFVLYAIIAIVVISILGIPTTTFVAAFSTVALTIGLALQGSLSNFAGGVLILLFKPFGLGDYIKEDTHGNEGTVVGIDLFYTKMQSVDNKIIVIPNGTLANASLTNFTAQQKRRVDISVGIAYDSDIKLAKEVMSNLVNSKAEILKDEGINIFVDSLDESQITMGLRVWVATEDYWTVKWDLLEQIKNSFDENKIEIPFNQLTVTLNENKG